MVQVTKTGFADLSDPISPKKVNIGANGLGRVQDYYWGGQSSLASTTGRLYEHSASASYIPANEINFTLEESKVERFYGFTLS